MNTPKIKFSKNNLWLVLTLMTLSMACSLSDLTNIVAQPTAVVYPTVAVLAPPTSVPPTVVPTISIKLSSADTMKRSFIAGDKVEITFLAKGTLGVPFVEMTLNSANGQSLASYGDANAQQGESRLEQTLTWTPEKEGEYTLYLTAYDTQKRASDPMTVYITVYPKPKIIDSDTVTLKEGDSYDFLTKKKGSYIGGDLYLEYEDDSALFCMSNVGQDGGMQSGGQYLFNLRGLYGDDYVNHVNEGVVALLSNPRVIKTILLDEIQEELPKVDYCLPVSESSDLYIYQRAKSTGEYILVLVDIGEAPNEVLLDYVVFELDE